MRRIPLVSHARRLRSKIPRRRRAPLFKIFHGSSNGTLGEAAQEFSDSYYSTHLPTEVSCNSSVISVESENPRKRARNPRKKGENALIGIIDTEFDAEDSRIMTRSYYKKRRNEKSTVNNEVEDSGVDLSECSRVESYTGQDDRNSGERNVFPEIKSKPSKRTGERNGLEQENVASEVFEPFSQKDVVSFCKLNDFSEINSAWKSKLRDLTDKSPENAPSAIRFSENSCLESTATITESNCAESTAAKMPSLEYESDLACSEKFSDVDESEYSTGTEVTLSELERELYQTNSHEETELSEYSQSSLSSADFEKNSGKSVPSACFQQFLEFLQQFVVSKFDSETETETGIMDDENSDNFALQRFEDEEHEESYQMLRSRERRSIVPQDHTEVYESMVDHGELVVQQRLQMVNWIVEHSKVNGLQNETLFLGVTLLDRFLSRGYFTDKRNLQLVGIACCTLATRIEENQPLNCIRQKNFHVGGNTYGRQEVVAMEWVVQKALNFQCSPPTIYNFLWFYLKAAKADMKVESLAKYLAVISLFDPELLSFWPSTIAAGLVILASLAVNRESSCHWVMETHVRTRNDDLPECIQRLEWLVKYVC